MKILEKKRKLGKDAGYTISHDVFLPMFIAPSEQAEEVMKGNLMLNPAVDAAMADGILSGIPSEYVGKSDWEAVKAGGYANLAELLAKQISMYPLVFEKGRFLKPDRRLKRMGDTAVIIVYPEVFLQRVQYAVGARYANQYMPVLASAQYRGRSTDPFEFNLFNRDVKDRWKQEMILAVRMNPDLRVTDARSREYGEKMDLMTGSLSDIAVVCPLQDLLKGRFPQEIRDSEYVCRLDSFKPAKKEIRQWVFSVAANVMSIVPAARWIVKLERIFPGDKWKVCSQVEKLFPDGAAMPRLAYFSQDGRDRVFLHINRIECNFFEFGEEEKRILRELVCFAETECGTRFCHMLLETNADLGVIKNRGVLTQTGFREERTCQKGDLFEHQFLEADYKLVPSVLGIEFSRRDWHYGVRLSTPDNEHIMWYDSKAVIDFLEEAWASNMARIAYLMRGDVYGRYRKIR